MEKNQDFMLMRLVNPSHLIGHGEDIKQSEPIRKELGVWRATKGCGGVHVVVHRGGAERHGGAQRGAWRGMEGAQRGAQRVQSGAWRSMEGCRGGMEGCAERCGGDAEGCKGVQRGA